MKDSELNIWQQTLSGQSLEIIYQHAGIGIILISKEGQFIEANPRFCATIGYTLEELKQISFFEITHPADRQVSDIWYQQIQESKSQVVTGEKRYVHKNGRIIWVKLSITPVLDSAGNILYFVTTVEDVTEKRTSEAMVRNQIKVLEMMAAGAPLQETALKIVEFVESIAQGGTSLVCLADQKGLHALAGPGFPQSYLAKVQGGPIGPVTGPCGAAAFYGYPIFSNNLATDACWSEVQRNVISDLGYRSVWAAPILSKTGKVIGTLNISWKVEKSPESIHIQLLDAATYLTGLAIERHLTDQLLNEQQLKLISASKLAALGEMAGGLAHEINNPLTVIALNANKLEFKAEQGPVESEFAKSLALAIHNTTKRISKIISGLRAFARDGEQDHFQSVAVEKIIEETLSFCGERFRSHEIELKLAVDPNLTLRCRPVQISQVILNLLNNAFDAVSSLPVRWVEIRAQRTGDQIEISVTDSGDGVNENLREKIFEPFFTTKDVSKGTGLGLSISSAIITSHRGNLILDTEVSETCFRIILPDTGPPNTSAY